MDTFELLIYHTAQEDASIEVVLKNETIWATQFRIWATSVLTEYDTFNRTQHIESDFDKAIKQLQLFEN